MGYRSDEATPAGGMTEFSLRLAWSIGARRVEVLGELDIATASVMLSAVDGAAAVARVVELDLSGVTFFDSQGLLALLDLRDRIGAKLRVVGPSRAVSRVLDITGTSDVFGAPAA